MTEKKLIIHSDEVANWSRLRDPNSKQQHLKVIEEVRQQEGVIEITSDKDPASAVNYFEPGDTAILYGQSTGEFGCVTRAAEALHQKGVRTTISNTPYSVLPWPPPENTSKV